ncbi:hypothetical protein APHAL10511_000704 [Amanita phalloides]|nr:hypothetical protein APHAL10511_000704 [Amanita phalloides]
MFVSRIALFALPALACASAVVKRTGPSSSCSTGPVQCCNSTQSSKNLGSLSSLLGLLGINVSNLTGLVGVTCSPITVIGAGGNSCNAQTVCCENNSFNGVVALGCTPINLNL